MTAVTLEVAKAIIAATRAKGREMGLKPLSVAVLDAGGYTVAFEREDGASPLRFKMAHAKAHGSIMLGIGSRAIFERAQGEPYFTQAVNALSGGALLPVPGGVLIKAADGAIHGAVGVTGDTSGNDEICAIAGIEAAGFAADPT